MVDPLYNEWLAWVRTELGNDLERGPRAARAAVEAVRTGMGYIGGSDAARSAWQIVPQGPKEHRDAPPRPAATPWKWPALADLAEPSSLALVCLLTVVLAGAAAGAVANAFGLFVAGMAVLSTLAGIVMAVIAGRLSPFAWTAYGERTEPGAARTLFLWAAAANVGWTYFLLLVGFASGDPSGGFDQAWAVAVGIFAVDAGLLAMGVHLLASGPSKYADTPYGPTLNETESARIRSASGAALTVDAAHRVSRFSGSRGLDLRSIFLLVLAGIALSFAMPTVWLIAYAGARSVGVSLGFIEAFGGRGVRNDYN